MAKVSISIPGDIATAAKDAGLNISSLATVALRAELDRRAKIAELGACLDGLEAEHGAISEEDAAEASRWADSLIGHHRLRHEG